MLVNVSALKIFAIMVRFLVCYGCYENLLYDVDLLHKYHEEPMDDTEDSIIDLRRVPLEVLDYPL